MSDLEELGSDAEGITGILRSLDLPENASVVDLGCGKGATSREIAAVLGYTVLGIDLFGPFVEHCRNEAEAAGLSRLCSFRQGDVKSLAGQVGPFDVAVFAALGDVLGPLDVTMGILRQYVKHGGYIVVSDICCRDGIQTHFPGLEGYSDLAGARQKLKAWGDEIVCEVTEEAAAPVASEEEETNAIRQRAEQIALRHPELRPQLERFADQQEAQNEYTDQNMVGVVWAVRRLERAQSSAVRRS